MQFIKPFLIVAASMVAITTTGCVSQPVAMPSYAQGVNNKSAEVIVPAIVDYVTYKLPPAQSTIYISKSKYSNLDSVIEDAFKAKGFAVSNVPDNGTDNIYLIRYEVSPFINGLLVNIFVDGEQATTMAVYWQKKWRWLGKYTIRGDSNV